MRFDMWTASHYLWGQHLSSGSRVLYSECSYRTRYGVCILRVLATASPSVLLQRAPDLASHDEPS